jgi:hypothetical protein
LLPKLVDLDELGKIIEKKKIYIYIYNSTFYYNAHSKTLSTHTQGDQVYFKHKPNSVWVPWIVTGVGPQPRSCTVQSPQGSFLRNREHILKPAVPINLPIQSPAFENQENIVNNTLQNDNTNNSQATITIKSGRIIKKAIRCR